MKKEYRAISAGLCEGRHPLPVDMYIFGHEIADPTDVCSLYEAAYAAIPEDITHIDLYATGLTVATLAVVQVCSDREISLTVMHYDLKSGTYYPQIISSEDRCGYCGALLKHDDSYCHHCGA